MQLHHGADKEPEFAAELINRIIDGTKGARAGIHVCHGNWSKREEVLRTGD